MTVVLQVRDYHYFVSAFVHSPLGFISLITRLPFDNIGVAVLSNDNDYGDPITNIIRWRLLDQALGLEKVDWNARFPILLTFVFPSLIGEIDSNQ